MMSIPNTLNQLNNIIYIYIRDNSILLQNTIEETNLQKCRRQRYKMKNNNIDRKFSRNSIKEVMEMAVMKAIMYLWSKLLNNI